MIFFFAFFLLVTFWSDLITSLRGPGACVSINCLRASLIGFTLFVVSVVALFLGLIVGQPDAVLLFDAIYAGFVNLLSILVALLFLVLGVILFRLLRRTDQLLTVAVVSGEEHVVCCFVLKDFLFFQKKKGEKEEHGKDSVSRNCVVHAMLCVSCWGFDLLDCARMEWLWNKQF